MTSEELRQKYRFLKLVAEQGVRTYHALNARGHIVMVHHLPSDSPETARLLTLLDALGPADKMRIVERLTVDGAPVVVTQPVVTIEVIEVVTTTVTKTPVLKTAATPIVKTVAVPVSKTVTPPPPGMSIAAP